MIENIYIYIYVHRKADAEGWTKRENQDGKMNRPYNPSSGLLAVNRKGEIRNRKRNMDKFVYPV